MVKTKKRTKKHVPQRTCVGCRTVIAKRALVRIVRTGDGVMIDPHGKMNGRGAYLHESRSCWEQGLHGRLAHALKTEINQADMAQLTAFMENLPEEQEND